MDGLRLVLHLKRYFQDSSGFIATIQQFLQILNQQTFRSGLSGAPDAPLFPAVRAVGRNIIAIPVQSEYELLSAISIPALNPNAVNLIYADDNELFYNHIGQFTKPQLSDIA